MEKRPVYKVFDPFANRQRIEGWAVMQQERMGRKYGSLRAIFWMGIFGGLAMVPFGFIVKSYGYKINIYGELIVALILGKVHPVAIMLQHMFISWSFAMPLFFALRFFNINSTRKYLLAGSFYGAGIWLFFNSLLLPIAFGRETPWAIGLQASWPSLGVHIIYGLAGAYSYDRFKRSQDN